MALVLEVLVVVVLLDQILNFQLLFPQVEVEVEVILLPLVLELVVLVEAEVLFPLSLMEQVQVHTILVLQEIPHLYHLLKVAVEDMD